MLFLSGRLVFGWMFFLVPLDLRAHNSAVECHLHTVEVVGSNPAVPTNTFNNLGDVTAETFAAFCGKSSEN